MGVIFTIYFFEWVTNRYYVPCAHMCRGWKYGDHLFQKGFKIQKIPPHSLGQGCGHEGVIPQHPWYAPNVESMWLCNVLKGEWWFCSPPLNVQQGPHQKPYYNFQNGLIWILTPYQTLILLCRLGGLIRGLCPPLLDLTRLQALKKTNIQANNFVFYIRPLSWYAAWLARKGWGNESVPILFNHTRSLGLNIWRSPNFCWWQGLHPHIPGLVNMEICRGAYQNQKTRVPQISTLLYVNE